MLIDAYRKNTGTEDSPPEDLLEAARREVEALTVKHREHLAVRIGSLISHRQAVREQIGEITGSPLLLQMRTTRNARVRLDIAGNSGPMNIDTPLEPNENLTHNSGGLIPPGHVFVIERARLTAQLGRGGQLQLTLPGVGKSRSAKRALDFEFTGRHMLRHGQGGHVEITGWRAAASLEISGRIVTEAAADKLVEIPLRLGPSSLLSDKPVTMQIYADHGGGNQRRVRLDGSLRRIDELSTTGIWNDAFSLKGGERSRAFYQGCGHIPPGKIYRITQIEYRARLDAQSGSHSSFSLVVAGERVIEEDGTKGKFFRGIWTGDVTLRPGQENTVYVACAFYAMGEIVVHGRVLDDPKLKTAAKSR